MKISGKRLIKFAEKEYGDTLEMLKNVKSRWLKQKVKKQLKTRIKTYLNKIENE